MSDTSPQLVSAVAISQEADTTDNVEDNERSLKKSKPNIKDESGNTLPVKGDVDAHGESTNSSGHAHKGRNNNVNEDVAMLSAHLIAPYFNLFITVGNC